MMRGRAVRLLLATIVIHLLLILPASPMPVINALSRFAPETILILLMLTFLRQTGRIILVVALSVLTLQKLADLAMIEALGRPFNLLADMPLIDAGVRLIAGTSGIAATALLLVAVLFAAGLTVLALWWATGIWSKVSLPPAARFGLAAAALLAVVPASTGKVWGGNLPYAKSRLDLARHTAEDLRELRQAAAQDPFADQQGLLSAIDRDVLIIFVESYGRTSFDTPFYADMHLPTLQAAEADLKQAGLAMRSGFLAAPTQGGQSWLSHATFANGLRVGDQTRYQATLASGRQSLFHHARRSGFRTAAVMPAITRPWPEAATMGFDRVLAADDLGYQGLPFNWVTMPDQFTLNATDRLLRSGGQDQPHLFAQVALISSHAPWVPVPELVDWDDIGDGRVFDHMAVAGDPPEVVWRDRDRVRDHYRASVDYSLRTVLEYARRHADDPPLLIVLGDHQAAPSIAMADSADTAIHLIGPAKLVDHSAAWGLTPGLIPPSDTVALPMERMRDLILGGFSDAGSGS